MHALLRCRTSRVVAAVCPAAAQITEIKVLLKSMLYMAPPPGAIEAMTLYIVVSDTESLGMIQDMIDESKLIGSRKARQP